MRPSGSAIASRSSTPARSSHSTHPALCWLASLRTRGIAGDDAFTVGSTLTVPLHDRTAAHAISVIHDADLAASSISTRQPTLDDVYLQLTGARLADAA